jgi:heat shock protein HslJ
MKGFWISGVAAALILAACGNAPATVPEPLSWPVESSPEVAGLEGWTARGQEPGWLLTIVGGTADFTYNYGEQGYSALLAEPKSIEGGIAYSEGDGGLAITVLKTVCADAATGMPYPDTVTVVFSGETYRGCGGDPQAPLTGAEWTLSEINGRKVLGCTRVTLAFDAVAGRVGGMGGCNSYGASYTLTGEGVTVGQGISTMMACAPAIMGQEQAFLKALDAVTTFGIDESGALVLSGPDGAAIVARR